MKSPVTSVSIPLVYYYKSNDIAYSHGFYSPAKTKVSIFKLDYFFKTAPHKIALADLELAM